jgi:hypothetical protein
MEQPARNPPAIIAGQTSDLKIAPLTMNASAFEQCISLRKGQDVALKSGVRLLIASARKFILKFAKLSKANFSC